MPAPSHKRSVTTSTSSASLSISKCAPKGEASPRARAKNPSSKSSPKTTPTTPSAAGADSAFVGEVSVSSTIKRSSVTALAQPKRPRGVYARRAIYSSTPNEPSAPSATGHAAWTNAEPSSAPS